MLDKISRILSHNPKLRTIQKPLRAARVCAAADAQGNGRYRAVSFNNGLLTVGVASSVEIADLQSQKTDLINKINQELGGQLVEKIRFKIE